MIGKLRLFAKKISPQWLVDRRRDIFHLFDRQWGIINNNILRLQNLYPKLINDKRFPCELNKYENKIYSQNGEDGLILEIFNRIGSKNNTIVEIGIEDGKQCNSANLIKNFGWNALLIESDEKMSKFANIHYEKYKNVEVLNRFIEKDNIKDILKKSKVLNQFCKNDEIDMLSIDIDGNDYWIWDIINNKILNPRAIIMEFNSGYGLKPITQPYIKDFNYFENGGYYFGASITAFEILSKKKGYTLVCCDRSGTNLFFVRNDLFDKLKIKKLNAKDLFVHQIRRDLTPDEIWEMIKSKEFIYIKE